LRTQNVKVFAPVFRAHPRRGWVEKLAGFSMGQRGVCGMCCQLEVYVQVRAAGKRGAKLIFNRPLSPRPKQKSFNSIFWACLCVRVN